MAGGWDGFDIRKAADAFDADAFDDTDFQRLLPSRREPPAPRPQPARPQPPAPLKTAMASSSTRPSSTTATKRQSASVSFNIEPTATKTMPPTADKHHGPTTNTSANTAGLQKWILAIGMATVMAVLLLYKEDDAMVILSPKDEEHDMQHQVGSKASFTKDDHSNQQNSGGGGWNFLKSNQNSPDNKCPADTCQLLHVPDILAKVQKEKQNLVQQLQNEYGQDAYQKLFVGNETTGASVGTTQFHGASVPQEKDTTTPLSRQRFLRKFKLKVLQVHTQVTQTCTCKTSSRLQRRLATTNHTKEASKSPPPPPATTFTRFVWANGGHSASAAHGNFYDESYTAVMEQSAKATFGVAGIDMEGRNYAMGGMSSGPLLSLCNEAVYGLDADIISWDYGMTDGRAYWKKSLYESRAGVHRNRPLIVNVGTGDGNKNRLKTEEELETAGLPCMHYESDMFQMKEGIPDMTTLKNQQEIDAVPPFVKYFRCGNELEKGDPDCRTYKYTNAPEGCNRPGQVSWHPGWKAHALQGNIMALFMIDLLIDALTELEVTTKETNGKIENLDEMISALQSEEDADYEAFANSGVPKSGEAIELDEESAKHVNKSTFFHGPIFCHTAIMPAEIRYLGILTESQNSSFTNYDTGMSYHAAFKREDKTTMALVEMEERDYKRQTAKCDKIVDVDHKDYFMAAQSDGGVTKVVVPNNMEKEVYFSDDGHSMSDMKGHVMVCFTVCPWGKCPKGNIMAPQFNDGNATMTINGEKVTAMKSVSDCSLLQNKEGFVWKPNSNGQYEIGVKVHQKNGYSRITTFIFL